MVYVGALVIPFAHVILITVTKKKCLSRVLSLRRWLNFFSGAHIQILHADKQIAIAKFRIVMKLNNVIAFNRHKLRRREKETMYAIGLCRIKSFLAHSRRQIPILESNLDRHFIFDFD